MLKSLALGNLHSRLKQTELDQFYCLKEMWNVKSPVAKQVDVVAPPLQLSGIEKTLRLLLQSISEDSLPVQFIGTPALFRFHPTTTTVNWNVVVRCYESWCLHKHT